LKKYAQQIIILIISENEATTFWTVGNIYRMSKSQYPGPLESLNLLHLNHKRHVSAMAILARHHNQ